VRPNALKHHVRSSIVSALGFVVAFGIIIGVVNFSHLDSHQLIFGILASLARVSAAYVIGVVAAIILALVITSNRIVENLLLPLFDVLQSFPSFALFPVLVVALQNSPEIIIVSVLALEIIWPILFSIITGIKNRREDLEEAATIFGATGWKRLRYFRFPALFPALVSGSIVGWGEAWEFIIGAELLVTVNTGIGHYLGILGNQHQNRLLVFGILVLMLFLFIINKLFWLPLLHRSTEYQTEA
jgi:ABC-type nitrate/sulfonate/bicarbonate transport system permease component